MCANCDFTVSEPPAPRFNTRRKSVFAEAYDPEADDDDTQKVLLYNLMKQQTVVVRSLVYIQTLAVGGNFGDSLNGKTKNNTRHFKQLCFARLRCSCL